MKKIILVILLLLISDICTHAQYYVVRGVIKNGVTKNNLSYANIRIENSSKGTASNSEGRYEIRIEEGNYKLIASYIGFKTDTVNINVQKNLEVNFYLTPVELDIGQVTVKPGKNPAVEIIEKAVVAKTNNYQKIENYKYSSFTKGLIKTTRDFAGGNFSLSTQDTGKLKITGILENESRGFFKKPDYSKHFIVARKQTANTPPFINILTGGQLLQSFYEDDLLFMGLEIPSPLSDKALDYYYFYIEKELFIDNKKVYQIFFNTDKSTDPGFYGSLFIEDSTYFLLKADVQLNRSANPGGLFEFVRVFQQFSLFENNIILPIDYRLFAEGNYLGLAKFGFELNTIMSDYEINTEIDADLFDNAVLTVLPGADKKDENYWNSIQSIPNTTEETEAYYRIDSLVRVSKTFGQDFSFLDSRIKLSNNFAVNGLINLYNFNRIEGHSLNFKLFVNDGAEQRLNLELGTSYGFSDDLLKKELSASYKLGNYRTSEISLSLYDKLTDLFGASDNYNKFTSTLLSLFTKYDFRDYYYSKGFDINFSGDLFPQLNLGIGYFNREDESADNRSDFSFFYKKRNYSENEQIFDSSIRGLEFSAKIDLRKFIEDGFFRRRITPRNYILFGGSATYSNQDIFNSDLDFTLYNLNSEGSIKTLGNWSLDFYGSIIFSNGNIPFQWLYALPGNISAGGKNKSFRTLRIGEVFGDKIKTLFLKHNFNDDLFKISGIPVLKDSQLQLSTHLNIAISDITADSKKILNKEFIKFGKPFYELGFSVGHLLIPLNFEFTWKLNYRGRNNFVFGINTFAL